MKITKGAHDAHQDSIRRLARWQRMLKSRRFSTGKEAEKLVAKGRSLLAGGQRHEAISLFHAAMRLDPTVACTDWGLLAHLESESRGSFRERMLARLRSWYGDAPSPAHRRIASLSNKAQMRKYIAGQNIPLPRQFATAPSLSALDWASLPADQIVIKPHNAANNDGVIIVSGGRDLMAGAEIAPDLPGYAQALYARQFKGEVPVLVEARLRDIEGGSDPDLRIPRDFKVFAIGGMAVFTRVHDRNAPDGKRWMATYDRNGRPLPAALTGWPEAPAAPVPQGYAALIDMTEALSRQFPWLLRFDFYLTEDGPVFGEFTNFPNAGLDCTAFGRRTLLQMWELWPDD